MELKKYLPGEDDLRRKHLLDKSTKNLLLVFSGPSGTGKDSIVSKLVENGLPVIRAVSFTTRKPRPWEVDGKDYYFVSEKFFKELDSQGEIFEYTQMKDKIYGYTNEEIDKVLNTGRTGIFVVDPYGYSQINHLLGSNHKIVSFFIVPPSINELQKRLEARGGMNINEIRTRIEQGQKWIIEDSKYYDYRIINENLQEAVDIVTSIFNELLYGNTK